MESKIKSMYDELYKSQVGSLEKAKKDALSNIDKQQNEMKEDIYNQRNQAAYNNAKNQRVTRDFMARSNLLASGENVDAIGRNNTDYANNVRSLDDSYNRYIKEYNDERTKINSNYDTDLNSLKADLEAKKIKDLIDYQMQQQAAAAARSYSSGGGSSRSSSGGGGSMTQTQMKQAMYDTFNQAYSNSDLQTLNEVIVDMERAGMNTDKFKKQRDTLAWGINRTANQSTKPKYQQQVMPY